MKAPSIRRGLGPTLLAAAEAAAAARVAVGRGRVDLRVPARPDGSRRVLTLVQRAAVPRGVAESVTDRGIISPSEAQPLPAVHLTTIGFMQPLEAGYFGSDGDAATTIADRLSRVAFQFPSRVNAIRLGATDATVFLAVSDDDHLCFRRDVARAMDITWSLRQHVQVINLGRFRRPPTLPLPIETGPMSRRCRRIESHGSRLA